MKNFFKEFKTFITRGNVMDMAVGVIVGGAFTSIVTALTNNILRPIINWIIAVILGDTSTTAYTILKAVYDPETNELLLDKSIYIDWGAFLSAIINFLLIALVLFCIVKTINAVAENQKKIAIGLRTEQEAVKKYRAEGLTKKEAVAKYNAEMKAEQEAKAAEEAAIAQAAAKAAEEKETANTRLLEEIRDLLKKNG